MKYKINILVIALVSLLVSCNYWDDHYNTQPQGSNENVWDALQKDANVSEFVKYLKDNQFDTLFATNNTYTLFAPTNEAFSQYLNSNDSVSKSILAYHVSKYFVQTTAIQGKRKIQTFNEKFALFNNVAEGAFIDDIPLAYESPLYKNGKYFRINEVAIPRMNLYEYIAFNNPVLKAYIDAQDSVVIDKERSTPVGFDEQGNTIYDTVADIINMFEIEFFEVSEEFRNKTATVVFPKEDSYNEALTAMAQEINAGYQNYEDIPYAWQEEILIPYLLERGVFENMIEREEFLKKSIKDTAKLKNILGDSVVIDYEPGEKTICSNGYAYDYYNFEVPDTLYRSPIRFEAEWLLESKGLTFSWYPWVKCVSSQNFPPYKDVISTASNDTVMRVSFTRGYTGTFSLEFNIDNLFPRKYLTVFRILPTKGGIWEIYMNNNLIRTFNYSTEISTYYVVNSVITGKKYYPKDGWTKFDCWIDGDLAEYGKAKMKLVYKGPGTTVPTNGIALDYIEFDPIW